MSPTEVYALNIFKKLPAGVSVLAFIGGGCFRSYYDGTPVKDYDLFFASYADWQLAVQWFRADERFIELTKPGEEAFPSFQSENDAPFNLIGFRFHKNAYELSRSFDFVCCAFAAEMTEPDVIAFTTHPNAVYDASHKRLAFLNHQHIDRVERRKARYVEQYGYTPTADFVAELPRCRLLPRSSSGGDY